MLRLQSNACCVHPRGMVLYGVTSTMGAGICVSRSLQSFGEARLPRMLVACRSVPFRLFGVVISECWSHA